MARPFIHLKMLPIDNIVTSNVWKSFFRHPHQKSGVNLQFGVRRSLTRKAPLEYVRDCVARPFINLNMLPIDYIVTLNVWKNFFRHPRQKSGVSLQFGVRRSLTRKAPHKYGRDCGKILHSSESPRLLHICSRYRVKNFIVYSQVGELHFYQRFNLGIE